ncbi:hypothetical protein AAMO2058_000526500 [Amorphochlora amoebiformis]
MAGNGDRLSSDDHGRSRTKSEQYMEVMELKEQIKKLKQENIKKDRELEALMGSTQTKTIKDLKKQNQELKVKVFTLQSQWKRSYAKLPNLVINDKLPETHMRSDNKDGKENGDFPLDTSSGAGEAKKQDEKLFDEKRNSRFGDSKEHSRREDKSSWMDGIDPEEMKVFFDIFKDLAEEEGGGGNQGKQEDADGNNAFKSFLRKWKEHFKDFQDNAEEIDGFKSEIQQHMTLVNRNFWMHNTFVFLVSLGCAIAFISTFRITRWP